MWGDFRDSMARRRCLFAQSALEMSNNERQTELRRKRRSATRVNAPRRILALSLSDALFFASKMPQSQSDLVSAQFFACSRNAQSHSRHQINNWAAHRFLRHSCLLRVSQKSRCNYLQAAVGSKYRLQSPLSAFPHSPLLTANAVADPVILCEWVPSGVLFNRIQRAPDQMVEERPQRHRRRMTNGE